MRKILYPGQEIPTGSICYFFVRARPIASEISLEPASVPPAHGTSTVLLGEYAVTMMEPKIHYILQLMFGHVFAGAIALVPHVWQECQTWMHLEFGHYTHYRVFQFWEIINNSINHHSIDFVYVWVQTAILIVRMRIPRVHDQPQRMIM